MVSHDKHGEEMWAHGKKHLVHEVTQVGEVVRSVQGPQQHLTKAPHSVVLIDGMCSRLPNSIHHILTDLHSTNPPTC